jgi:hypothetical protein
MARKTKTSWSLRRLRERVLRAGARLVISARRMTLILAEAAAPRQRRAGRDRRKMGLRHEGLHQVGMPGCMTPSQQNFQTSGCSILERSGARRDETICHAQRSRFSIGYVTG